MTLRAARCVGCEIDTPTGVDKMIPRSPSDREAKPLLPQWFSRAAPERRRPQRSGGNGSRTVARLPGRSIGSTKCD